MNLDTSDSLVFCSGHDSCSFAALIKSPTIRCSGSLACGDAVMVATTVLCEADRSCDSAVFESGDGNMSLYLLGYESALDASVTCTGTSICFIYCVGYASCEGMTLETEDDASFVVECDEYSDCPVGWTGIVVLSQ